MAPIVCTDDDMMMDRKQLFFEASVLHRIPPEILIQSSSSTRYHQSFSNGITFKSWLSARKKDRNEERLKRLAKFHAELLGRTVEPKISYKNRRTEVTTNNESSDKENDSTAASSPDCSSAAVDRNEKLLDLTLKTIVLLHHNQQLQNKLTALQIETRNLVRSYHHRRKNEREIDDEETSAATVTNRE